MDGLHVVGILKSIGFSDEDEPTENVSSPLGGLNGLRDRGLEKKEGSTENICYLVVARFAVVRTEADFE